MILKLIDGELEFRHFDSLGPNSRLKINSYSLFVRRDKGPWRRLVEKCTHVFREVFDGGEIDDAWDCLEFANELQY